MFSTIQQVPNERKYQKLKQYSRLFGLSIAWIVASLIVAMVEFVISDATPEFSLSLFIETKFYIWLSLAFFLDLGMYLSCKKSEKINSKFVVASFLLLGGVAVLLLTSSIKDLNLYFNTQFIELNIMLFFVWIFCFIIFKTLLLIRQKC